MLHIARKGEGENAALSDLLNGCRSGYASPFLLGKVKIIGAKLDIQNYLKKQNDPWKGIKFCILAIGYIMIYGGPPGFIFLLLKDVLHLSYNTSGIILFICVVLNGFIVQYFFDHKDDKNF